MRIALISLNQIWENKEANKKRCATFIEKASKDDVDLIIFPEMTLTGFSMNSGSTAEDTSNSETVDWFKENALKFNIKIIFGYVQSKGNKALNKLIAISEKGEIIASYSKIHPFSYAEENRYFEGGESLGICSLNNSKNALAFCYHLRFPELYQALSKDCSLIVNIANWPAKRADHWSALLKARAIENQVFMMGINRIGTDENNITYVKSSQIIDPEGKLILPIYSEDEYDLYELDTDYVKEVRKKFPFKNDRKTELYKRVL